MGVQYDPFSYEIDEDPYPVYRQMRDETPLYYDAEQDFYALTRFDDVLAALIDRDGAYTSTWSTSLEFMDGPKPDTGLMIWMDPPAHNRYRGLVIKAFTPRRISELESEVRAIATGYLDPLVGRERFDVVSEFTARLPMDVISALLGIPEADRRWVQESSNSMLHRDPGNPMPRQEAIDAQQEVLAFFDEQIAERRERPRDDMMTVLTQVELEDAGERARLSDHDIRQFLMLLGTAGNETVTKFAATIFHELARHPDQRRALTEDPSRIPGCVEETLRYDPPSQYQGRVTTRETLIHGQRVPAHARMLLINGATGRDGRAFPDPDRYDVGRNFDFHLGLGYGRHICLGASLARLESRIATEELLRRFPEYGVPEGGATRMHSSNVRGLSGLVLEPTAG